MGPIAGPGREPRLEMSAGEAVELLTHLGANGVDVWLDGGWAVDAALGMQTREHDDLDLIVELQHVERLETAGDARSTCIRSSSSSPATVSTGSRTARTGSIRRPASRESAAYWGDGSVA
jgi:hypothetical protein